MGCRAAAGPGTVSRSAKRFSHAAGLGACSDAWQVSRDLTTQPMGQELHGLVLTADQLEGIGRLDFTWQWQQGTWQGEDFHIVMGNPE